MRQATQWCLTARAEAGMLNLTTNLNLLTYLLAYLLACSHCSEYVVAVAAAASSMDWHANLTREARIFHSRLVPEKQNSQNQPAQLLARMMRTHTQSTWSKVAPLITYQLTRSSLAGWLAGWLHV
ncbi:hypothetical protein IWX91DRAFT_341120 [Phyllosticta citricarpa]